MPPPRREKPDRFIRSVKLSGIQKRYLPNKHYVYVFKVKWSDGTGHIIYRSYSDFFEFHTELVDLFPLEAGLLSANDRIIPNFPRRKFYERNEMRQFARQQQVQFEQYCNQLISMKSPIVKHPFLLLFFQPRYEDIDPSNSILSKPGKTKGLKKMMQKFSSKSRRYSHRISMFDQTEIPKGVIAEQYKALNGFKADVDGQVTFGAGDLLKVIEKNPCGWWIAEVPSGETGWVPGSFLEKLENSNVYEEYINVDGELYMAMQSYHGQNDDELSFDAGVTLMVMQKRMTGWWIARYNGDVGYVPAAYLTKYTNEDYLRVCTPIMPLKAKPATINEVTPLPDRRTSLAPGALQNIIPKSPRRQSVMEIRSEEEALERAKTMVAFNYKLLAHRDSIKSQVPGWKAMAIPKIIVTEPDEDIARMRAASLYASIHSLDSMRTHDDSNIASCFEDGSWKKIHTKCNNITQGTANNKLSVKTSPFGEKVKSGDSSVASCDDGSVGNKNQDIFNNLELASLSSASTDRKSTKFKLTHNSFKKFLLDGRSQKSSQFSASDPDVPKVGLGLSDIDRLRGLKPTTFGSRGSVGPNLSTAGLAGSRTLDTAHTPLGTSVMLEKMMNSANMKYWSSRACAGSEPNLAEMKTPASALKPQRKPFHMTEKERNQTGNSYDLGLEFGWYGAGAPLRTPMTVNHCRFANALTPKELGLLNSTVTQSEPSLFVSDEDSVFFHGDGTTPAKSIKKINAPMQHNVIATPQTAANMNWAIFKDDAQLTSTCKASFEKDKEKIHCEGQMYGSNPAVLAEKISQNKVDATDGPSVDAEKLQERTETNVGLENRLAITKLVEAIQDLTDVIRHNLPAVPARVVVKDESLQCDLGEDDSDNEIHYV